MSQNPQLPLPGEEAIKLDKKYVIMEVKDFTSEVQKLHGWRVTLDGGGDDLLAIPLWFREVVGRRAKMGSFIAALGNDPDAWVGHTIQFVAWAERNREIKVVK